MNRLGIAVFYDCDGVLDPYFEVILKEISCLCQKLIVAVNGNIQKESLAKLGKYTNDIWRRENTGFDAGAYKDVLLNCFSAGQEKQFDELILFNDTFYGPLYPLNDVWERFENEDVDFWGITRYPGGEGPDGKKIPTHIQSYFLVIRKSMFHSEAFQTFWKAMQYPGDIGQAILRFEVEFTEYFTKTGFCGKALTDLKKASYLEKWNTNPYTFYNFEMVRYMRIPFLKKKIFICWDAGYKNALAALKYVEENLNYDTQLIWNHIFRLGRDMRFPEWNFYVKTEQFYNTHKRVFIYGAGNYGERVNEYFQYKKWINSGFIISENQPVYNENVYVYSDMKFEKEDGIIIAMGKKYAVAVYEKIRREFLDSQLMMFL